MSDVKRPEIKPAANGPLLVQGMEKIVRYIDGKIFEGGDSVAPCRCGGSKKKPYCDGTHAKNGFSSEKDPSHLADKRENFEGGGIEVHDNRGVCAHAGRCTEGLPNVFRLRQEPFVDATAASADEIAATIEKCPSGALSYSIDGVEHSERGGESSAAFAPNGPYVFAGGAELHSKLGEGATMDHFTLCRCGASTNKPFCSGAHWNVSFDEDAHTQDG